MSVCLCSLYFQHMQSKPFRKSGQHSVKHLATNIKKHCILNAFHFINAFNFYRWSYMYIIYYNREAQEAHLTAIYLLDKLPARTTIVVSNKRHWCYILDIFYILDRGKWYWSHQTWQTTFITPYYYKFIASKGRKTIVFF